MNRRRALLLGLILPAMLASSAQAKRLDRFDRAIAALMAREDVKGLAIVVIERGRISKLSTYGFRNVEQALPLQTDTVMYGASLTKAAFAYMVLQLVDDGKIDLDRPIASYLKKPLPEYEDWASLAGDDRWRAITARMVLNHATGLPNLRSLESDQQPHLHFVPGTNYSYSGEGFYLLQFVLEEGLGLKVKDEMQRRIFDRFGMTRTSMQWREDFAGNLADGYAIDGSFEPHDHRDWVSASGSMDTTIADQAKLWRAMLAGEGLSVKLRAEWTRPQLPIHSAHKFPTIENYATTDPRAAAVGLSAALGVETWRGPGGRYFEKGGHNDWTGNLVICREADQSCLILLSNSVRAELIYPQIVELVLGRTDYPWWWAYTEVAAQVR